TRLAGTPGLLNRSVLAPLNDGSLLRQPLDGSKGSYGPGWRARTADEGARGHVIVLSADDFLTADGSRGLTRWHWAAGDGYKEERRIDLSHRIVSPPAIIRSQGSEVRDQKLEASGQKSEGGELVCVADAAGQVRLLHASDLQEIRHWD